MRLYRFSPITTQDELVAAIRYLHKECHKLCKEAFGEYLPVAGNIGVFSHYDDEYRQLVEIQQSATTEENPFNGKYFKLLKPIRVEADDDIPGATYTHLYVRKPDPYRHHVGDVDFYLEEEKYKLLYSEMQSGKRITSARIYPADTHNMIELHNPDSDALGYVNYKTMKDYL